MKIKPVYIAFIFLLGFSLTRMCYSQAQSQPTLPDQKIYRILGIQVAGFTVGGADSAAIISHSGLSVGDEITLPGIQVRNSINRLLALRIFSDVEILGEKKPNDGIFITIKVKEYPHLIRVELKGRDEISEDDIKKQYSFVADQHLTPAEIKKAINDIKTYYASEGYLLTQITPETIVEDSTKPNYVVLRLNINEGPEVTIGNINFEGNKAFDNGDLKGEMEDTKEKVWWKFWSSPKLDTLKYRDDKKKVLQFYHKNGYLDAEILSDSIWYTQDKKKVNINIRVFEGPQYRLRNVTWDGATVFPTVILNARVDMKRGDIFNQQQFNENLKGNKDLNDINSMYRDQGYLTMEADPEINRVPGDSVDVTVRVMERNQFKVGRVELKGNSKTNDYVIRRELYVKPGDFYSQAKVVRSIRQLQQLNYFNMEKLAKGPDLQPVDDQTVNVAFDVEEKSSDNVNASIGYSQVFGVTGALGFTINNFSLTHPLTGGDGQIFDFQWQFGQGQSFRTFNLGFTEPWLYGSPTTLGVNLYDTRQNYVFDLEERGVSVRFGRRLKWPDDYFRADWTVKAQHNDVYNNGGYYYYTVGKTSQYSVNQTITRNSVDNPTFPTSGSNVSLSMEMAGGPVLPGNVDYHKWLFEGDWYTPIAANGRLVLATLSSFGYVSGFSNSSYIPPLETFWMGGTGLGAIATTPLRGYEERSIGPRDDVGREIGGRVMEKETAELRFSVTLEPIPIYVLAFMDAGNIFADFTHTDLFDLKRSVGFGARLLMPQLGLIGFDYGYGLDDVTGGYLGFPDGKPDGWQFHFQFGRGF